MNQQQPKADLEPKTKMGVLKKVGIGLAGLAVLGYIGSKGGNSTPLSSLPSASDTLSSCYSVSKRMLKSGLKDPSSFQEIEETKYFVKPKAGKVTPAYVQVLIKYRAKNSFGGYKVSKQAFNFNNKLVVIDSYEMDL